ncbi:MAG: zinc metallopeptidase [Lachnospiraceae bacterium]|nr:zinc metallopeptidase [Lachnospiraceae bacterium]
MRGFYFGIDPTYILILIGAVICMIASAKLRSTYSKYSRVRSMSGITGAEAAKKILYSQGIRDVSVEHVAGDLTDHYDPRSHVLRLSDTTYADTSVAAVGVAAHECGHAVQHATGYALLNIRNSIAPVVSIGSNLSWPLILLGVILSWNPVLIRLGIWMFALAVIFQLVTLPVELDASRRALRLLQENGILYQDEVPGAKRVLSAAAMTYVAGLLSVILQMLRLVLLFGGNRRDD